MQRRNFLKALGSALLAPLVTLIPRRAPDDLVIDWRDNVSVLSNWDVRDNIVHDELDVESFDEDGVTFVSTCGPGLYWGKEMIEHGLIPLDSDLKISIDRDGAYHYFVTLSEACEFAQAGDTIEVIG